MAEGYSYNPDDEESVKSADTELFIAKKPDAADRFKNFIGELFKPKESKEKDEDDESEKKKSRFSRLWRSLFSSVASKEDVAGENIETPRRGLFFEATESAPAPEVDLRPQSLDLREQREDSKIQDPRSKINEGVESSDGEPTPDIVADSVAPLAETAPESPVNTTPELVVVGGLTSAERYRLHNIEAREKRTKAEVKKLKQEIEQKTSGPEPLRHEVKKPEVTDKINAPTAANIQPEKSNILNPQYKTEKTPEVIVQTKESYKEVEKQEIIDKILKTDSKEVDEHKEISYELSHEHKDMDKQTAGAWAVMQANADAQAKANAAAIAAAQNLARDKTLVASDSSAVPKDDKTMYKKAALGGFVSAVVIIAIIIVIILIQSNQ